ncbi:MAG: LLM class F420-dependent oxidoreductase, partial [Acidimicrobiales bacterium]
RQHCDRVGRDQSEIARSIHLGFDTDSDPAALADKAASFFDAGVDIVVWSMRGPMEASRLEPLASALR